MVDLYFVKNRKTRVLILNHTKDVGLPLPVENNIAISQENLI